MTKSISYLTAFIASLSFHTMFFGGWEYFSQYLPGRTLVPVAVQKQPLKMRFVDAYQTKVQQPPKHVTRNFSDKNNVASQKEKPAEKLPIGGPYMKKVSNSAQIKTVLKPNAPTPVPPVQVQPSASEQFLVLDQQKPVTSEAESKQAPLTENKPNPVKDEEKPVKKDLKTISIAKPQKSEPTSEQARFAKKPAPPTAPQLPAGARLAQKKPDILEGKIDELLHNAQVDTQSVAELMGEIQHNIRKNELGDYYASMKRKISRNWKTKMLHYGSDMFSSSTVIVFKINHEGKLVYIKSLGYSGNKFFGQDCEAAVRSSAKFDPLPAAYTRKTGKKDLWVYVSFGYNTDD